MKIEISGNIDADEKTRRYVKKVIGSLDRYLPKTVRDDARAEVIMNRVNRAHGNKYEAEVRLRAGTIHIDAKDSTLNVLAALDIVKLKLVLALKKSPDEHLPRRQKRV